MCPSPCSYAGPQGLASVGEAVYARSYLGYGAVAMEGRVKSALLATLRGNGSAAGAGGGVNPCGFEGHLDEVRSEDYEEGGGASESASDGKGPVTLRGAGDFRACQRVVRAALAAMQGAPGGTGAVALPPAALKGAQAQCVCALVLHQLPSNCACAPIAQ